MTSLTKNVPALRFPEFAAAAPWETKKLGEVFEIYQPETISSDVITETGPYKVYGANGVIGYHTNYNHVDSEVLITCRGATCGTINLSAPKSWITGNAMVIKPKTTQDIKAFVYFYLQNYSLELTITGSAQPQITYAGIKNYLFLRPSLPEQQKIADCLTSLDDLINAQSEKLNCLRDYKKGLLQQLFPVEGETIPRLRFPEFADSAPWETKKLSEVCKDIVASGDVDFHCLSNIRTKEFPYPVYSNAIKNEGIYGYYSNFKYPKDSITITGRGDLGKAFYRKEEFMGIGRLLVLFNFIDNAYFVMNAFNHLITIPIEATGVPQLTTNKLKLIQIPVPTLPEQEKIAGCLSSLDDQITAASEQLVTLKSHKKGLMQQLFPVIDGF